MTSQAGEQTTEGKQTIATLRSRLKLEMDDHVKLLGGERRRQQDHATCQVDSSSYLASRSSRRTRQTASKIQTDDMNRHQSGQHHDDDLEHEHDHATGRKCPPPAGSRPMRPNQDLALIQASRRDLLLGVALLATALIVAGAGLQQAEARITFEKMTNRDYSGSNYYTIQNVSLFECLGWCKEESSCTSAVFSFVVNPFAALQETTCMLQNETNARQGAYLRTGPTGEQVVMAAQPQKATNLYFFNKVDIQTESVCSRLWAFERFPNRRLRQRDRQPFHAASKEICQASCMNEQRFVCRSIEYNYISQQCVLSAYDRRSPLVQQLASQTSANSNHQFQLDLIEAPGTDYFENACLLGEDICNESRIYDYVKIGLPLQRVAHFVELNYYPDKEMLVKSQAGCIRACTIEHEFICRSILFRSTFKQGQPNCALYHLDQRTFPDGAEAFMSHGMQPLLDSGETNAVYLEAICNDTIQSTSSPSSTSMTLSVSGISSTNLPATTITTPPSTITIVPSSSTTNGISIFPGSGSHQQQQQQNHSTTAGNNNDDLERFISSQQAGSSTLSPIMGAPTTIRLPSSFMPPGGMSTLPSGQQVPSSIRLPDLPARNPHITISPSGSSSSSSSSSSGNRVTIPERLTISPAPPPQRGDPLDVPTNIQVSVSSPSGNSNHDQNCDAHGFCYDVALKCTDTKMVVNVKTQRPFFGRIYALGRSETCNANIKNQNQFQLDMYLTGQECNTQSAHHNVVLTKADKVYHVRCTYETASRNVSFGMAPVKDMFEVDVNDRNQETISITASSDAPLPKISILTLEGKEASTVRIGDRLTFRIEIPDNTPYGIFARSCVAMAKDARSTFEIIDEHGCPVDHTIFPNFIPANNGNALESNYEAFRFTESYGVIFQCNVKYCIGKCEPVNCGIGREQVESWGRKKRSIGANSATAAKKGGGGGTGKPLGDDMTLSREIVVLDLKDKPDANGLDTRDDLTSSSEEFVQKSPLRSAGQQADQSPDDGRSAAAALDSESPSQLLTGSPGANLHCLTSQSLLWIICSIGFVFVAYVCSVAYFFSRRETKISVIKHQYH